MGIGGRFESATIIIDTIMMAMNDNAHVYQLSGFTQLRQELLIFLFK
jgi:hypothetical protein